MHPSIETCLFQDISNLKTIRLSHNPCSICISIIISPHQVDVLTMSTHHTNEFSIVAPHYIFHTMQLNLAQDSSALVLEEDHLIVDAEQQAACDATGVHGISRASRWLDLLGHFVVHVLHRDLW